MKRQRAGSRAQAERDPVGDEALGAERAAELNRLIELLPDEYRSVVRHRFGMVDGKPKSPHEISLLEGRRLKEVKRAYDWGVWRLRRLAAEGGGLEELLTSGHIDVPLLDLGERDRAERRLGEIEQAWQGPTCLHCGEKILRWDNEPGRPKKYCSGRCRTAAWRQRKAGATSEHGTDPDPWFPQAPWSVLNEVSPSRAAYATARHPELYRTYGIESSGIDARARRTLVRIAHFYPKWFDGVVVVSFLDEEERDGDWFIRLSLPPGREPDLPRGTVVEVELKGEICRLDVPDPVGRAIVMEAQVARLVRVIS